ncbi:hypothetical protein ACFL1R_09335 [Candidatus Latescibacterota bacterium]
MKRNLLILAVVLGVFSLYASLCAAVSFKSPDEQRELEQRYDKLSILRITEMQTDTSVKFVTIPDDYPEVREFDVAQTPPTVDFAIVQGLEPWYLPSFDSTRGGVYGGWGDVTKGPDGCFYFSIGNHMSYGGTAYIIKYEPLTKTQSIVLDMKKVIGWDSDDFADGKLHGDPDIGPGGDMWLLSFFGPQPTQKDLDTVYRGSWLLRHNIFTGETENLGIPLEGESWPYHSYDWQRGVFFGVGTINGYVIAYDTKTGKMIYGGSPPQNINWYRRGVLLDRSTGKIYTTSTPEGEGKRPLDEPNKFVCWERRNNTFTIMNSETPGNPVHGKRGPLRAHTKRKDADGAFWCFDFYGTFFRFYPDNDRVELIGVNWGESGKYIANMCLSPKGQYIYYVADSATHAAPYGTPVIQYNTKTNRKKVIAFLNDFYLEKYGYSPGGTYGVELDEKGETLFFYTNGQFTAKERGTGYGRPAIFHLHIPESEREE